MKQSDNSVKLENLMPAGPFMKRTGARVEIEEGKATRMLPMRREFTMPPTPCMAHFIFGHWTTRPFSRPTLAEDVLVLAINFTTDLTRPVSADTVTAFGKVINTDRSPFNQDSVFYDDHRRGFNFSDPVVKSQTIIVSV